MSFVNSRDFKHGNYHRQPTSFFFLVTEKLAAPSSQASPTSIPYATRAEIKTENIQPETSKGKFLPRTRFAILINDRPRFVSLVFRRSCNFDRCSIYYIGRRMLHYHCFQSTLPTVVISPVSYIIDTFVRLPVLQAARFTIVNVFPVGTIEIARVVVPWESVYLTSIRTNDVHIGNRTRGRTTLGI